MFDNIQTFSFANIDKFSTSGLVTRLTTDVTNIQNAYMMILRMAMRAPASLIIAMIAAFTINAKLASIYLVAVIFLAIIMVTIMGKTTRYFKQVFEKYDELNESVQENVSAIRVVKAYVREEHENKKFKKAAANIYKMFVKAENNLVFISPVMSATVYICILLVSWFGAHLIVGGELTTGNLMSLLTYCMTILMNLMMLGMIFVMMTMASASGKRIAEVIEEKSSITNKENPIMEVKDGSIAFEHVNFEYNEDSEQPVLKDINLEIKSGETIGIIGGTGSAKSSLVNLIPRFYDADSGQVLVDGIDVKDYPIKDLRGKISILLQKAELFSDSIAGNIKWGKPEASIEEIKESAKIAQADGFIKDIPNDYDNVVAERGMSLSGGQKQRISIARAVLKSAEIMILDDSTSALDLKTESDFYEALSKAKPNSTKIIIAQRIASVKRANRIVVLENGSVCACGSHDELLKSCDIYKDIYNSQMGEEAKNG